MTKSPCSRCGRPTLHTEDDLAPLCEHCLRVRTWEQIIDDVLEGRVDGQEVLRGMKTNNE